ncbi:peptidylprolyl isomerase [Candidatus Woesearchaeota archaeon]|jgi:FKBP-type peptidyl-prolyl cis-trans isomerase 2|nr:peptidylprolyl isomerase [Candidatus Woesearchaeota archaeon]MBT3438554.1 peptidylprolyl isomerase [Candidatus Woesearchaeota archaeon]MBT4058323.1 peptidylprolyl isomerase [Candidatus Woesearchaeota archaeon]MBT4732027.1 peptidylprolyl isomerase [Candidatus Woesearchaeota archaeon]MBT4783410.1 peptidylprolyl isomerase [Candidatus Woesearchaeota archaeon]
MVIKKGDFVEIDFIGRVKEGNHIFDLTKKSVAEKEGIVNKNAAYSPKIICVGNGDVVKGLDNFLEGKEIGKKYEFNVSIEEGFGRKDAKLIKMLSLNVFKKQNLRPFPGLQIDIDGAYGTVRTVSGGRVLVDFNHPLSGKELNYEIEINKLITDDTEKVKSVLKGMISKDIECSVKDGNAMIDLDLPEQYQKILAERIKKSVKSLKKVDFKKKELKKETVETSK